MAKYGLIGRIRCVAGARDQLVALLREATHDMPGCDSYVVARDVTDANVLWITEVWESADHHRASLQLPAVQAAIARGRPLIAAFESRVETAPV